MDSLQNRLIFALSILKDNDHSARLILSDLLESEGDTNLADWTRAKKKSWRKRLDGVIGVLPHMITLQITCDFVAKGLLSLPTRQAGWPQTLNDEDLSPLAHEVENVSRWARGESPETILDESLRKISSVHPWQYGIFNISIMMQSLHLAISCAVTAEKDTANARKHADSSRNASRKVIKATREMTKRHPKGNFNMSDLRAWQFSHTISVLESHLTVTDS